MSDLIERLTTFNPYATTKQEALQIEAADQLEAQQAEIARLREALGVLETAGSKMLEAVDHMNEKEGTFLCGGPIFQLAKAIGSARAELEQKP